VAGDDIERQTPDSEIRSSKGHAVPRGSRRSSGPSQSRYRAWRIAAIQKHSSVYFGQGLLEVYTKATCTLRLTTFPPQRPLDPLPVDRRSSLPLLSIPLSHLSRMPEAAPVPISLDHFLSLSHEDWDSRITQLLNSGITFPPFWSFLGPARYTACDAHRRRNERSCIATARRYPREVARPAIWSSIGV
jgi:hypothetical protein